MHACAHTRTQTDTHINVTANDITDIKIRLADVTQGRIYTRNCRYALWPPVSPILAFTNRWSDSGDGQSHLRSHETTRANRRAIFRSEAGLLAETDC